MARTIPLLIALALIACAPIARAAQCLAPTSTDRPDFDGPFRTSCEFHQWALQEFLYLTDDTGSGAARFLRLGSPPALFVESPPPFPPTAPIPMHCEGASTVPRRHVMVARLAKSDQSLGSIGQAGSGEVLVDQAGQPVYYTADVNEDYYDFVVGAELNTKAGVESARPALPFPVGAVEVKSAWRVVKDDRGTYIEDASGFHVIEAYIVPPGKRCVIGATLALTGLHVVGRVARHPEFVWSTFEHRANAPTCASAPHGRDTWSFHDGRTACGRDGEGCNEGVKVNDFEAGSTPPSEVCRVHPSGGPGMNQGKPAPQNQPNIDAMNAGLRSLGNVWRNYRYVGAQWSTATDSPVDRVLTIDRATTEIGSINLANTSVESFTQDKSCFDCHNPAPFALESCLWDDQHEQKAKNIFFSHLVALVCAKR